MAINVGALLFGALFAQRLVQLQLVNRGYYVGLAAQSHMRKYTIPAKRGTVYLKDQDKKAPLALNQNLKILYADPTFIKDKAKTATALAQVTGDPVETYLKAFDTKGSYVALKHKVNQSLAEKIIKLNLSGVGLSDQQYRIYPEGELASQLLGFVNSEGAGQYGLERYLEQELAGKPGLLKAKTDIKGIPIATVDNINQPPKDGSSFVLTIDRNIQAQAEKYLREGVQAVGATSGSVVIINPSNGEIMAMANYPTYDASKYSSVKDYGVFANPVVSGAFEPGSGFKVFTMAAGLNTGKVNPETTYDDTGEIKIKGETIRNAENHKFGIQNMGQVIQRSLNTGVVFVLKSLGGDAENITLAGKKIFHEYLTKHFGFGVRTGIEQPSESAGLVNPPGGYDINYANMTFGQGISATMIQMVVAMSAVVNGGKLYQPHLVSETIHSDGKISRTNPRVINANAVKPETGKQLIPMMISVVEHGSGYMTKIPGYQVGGKTGTAQIPRADGKGYEENKNIGSFIGFAPAQDPRFVMMVRINEPKVSGFAESTTVPVFANIAKWLLRYLNVPPSS